MRPEEIRALVQEIERRASPAVELLPGTLETVFGGQGTVVLDGTSSVVTVDVVADCKAQDRVMVLFVPPRGAFVIGRYGGASPGPGWNLLDSAEEPGGDVTLRVPEFASSWTRFRFDATGRNPAGASPLIVEINGGALTMAGNTSYYVDGNGVNSTFVTAPTSSLNAPAEWGAAIENVAYLDIVRNNNVLSITGGGARYSNTLGLNRRFFTQARATLTASTFEEIRATDGLPFFAQPPTIEFSSVTLYGLNPE